MLADVGYERSSSVSQLGFEVKVPCLAYLPFCLSWRFT